MFHDMITVRLHFQVFPLSSLVVDNSTILVASGDCLRYLIGDLHNVFYVADVSLIKRVARSGPLVRRLRQ